MRGLKGARGAWDDFFRVCRRLLHLSYAAIPPIDPMTHSGARPIQRMRPTQSLRRAPATELEHQFQSRLFHCLGEPFRVVSMKRALLTTPDCANTPTRAPSGEALLDSQHQRMRQTTVNEAIIGVLWTAQIRARPDKDIHLRHNHLTGSIL